jgi:uncharacterized protein YqgV (UPF0045/DUF77 family)
MLITVEISMYPFRENYRELIQEFIGKLESFEKLKVTPGPTSTVIVGEYSGVMECITEMIEWSHRKHGRAVFAAKFILGYDPD